VTKTPQARRPSLAGRGLDRLAGRVFGIRPATSGYSVTRGVRVPMRDSVELAADLYQPTSRAVGTLLIRGPYGRSLLQALAFARIFAARGYNALYVSSRGTFGSGGVFSPMVNEVDDGHDVVAWMRDQPWFTGRFATVGGSYLGFTQWALLADPPEEMATAVISIAPHDFGQHVWGTGAFRLDFLAWSHMIVHQEEGGALQGSVRVATAKRHNASAMNELPLTAAASGHLEGRAPWYTDWVTRPDLNDPFWKPMNLDEAVEQARIPILLFSGWQDLFLEQTVDQYSRLREQGVEVAMTVGPWSHLAVGTGAARATTTETFEWLEEHLVGTGAPRRRSPVRVFVTGANEWRELPVWPPTTSTGRLFLGPHGDLSTDPPGEDAPSSSFLFDPSRPTPTVGGPLMEPKCTVDDTDLAGRADVACYTSRPLKDELEIMGAPVLELAHSSDNPHADIFARISEVDFRDRSHNLTEGYVRLEPGRPPGPVSLNLRPAAHRFVAGTRIRLVVAGGSHPQFARNLGTDDNPGTGVELLPCRHTIGHGRGGLSSLCLPVAGGDRTALSSRRPGAE
jgi:uncharacterized protein